MRNLRKALRVHNMLASERPHMRATREALGCSRAFKIEIIASENISMAVASGA